MLDIAASPLYDTGISNWRLNMAFFIMVKADDGPDGALCASECNHKDCAAERAVRLIPCSYCGNCVTPGDRAYIEHGNYVHALCAEESAEGN